MTNQDKRAVESMCQCGLDLDGVIASFPKLDPAEIEEVFYLLRKNTMEIIDVPVLSVNCS